MLQQAQAQLALENDNIEAHDNKVYAFLALEATVAGVLIATRDSLQPFWWTPLLGLAVSAGCFGAALWPRRFDLGPDIRRFYAQWARDPDRFNTPLRMLTEVNASNERNRRILPAKARWFYAGAVLLLVTAVAGGALVGITTWMRDHPHHPHAVAMRLSITGRVSSSQWKPDYPFH
jgi:hypothetical protein